ncbi:hypothetical protein [Geotoga petraea]|jgi:hypothetical protein|uniref:Cyclic nucleotide-binding domain-containing protein n=1 Tax=Geotoga petraea TaxID=28234 RepID=A0A1G6I0R5_9BACT|nr:hypothetical protein [Geotoga petraea]TGG89051.1 hypothetical protein E4650_02325 [Geotoga petraea]SDC00149.1 hypothetical protein SAMN04488588_0206 [Geotoga petraea]
MKEVKKNEILIKKDEIPKKFYYIVDGEVENNKKIYRKGNFIALIHCLIQTKVSDNYKIRKNAKLMEFSDINDIDKDYIDDFLKYVSKYTNNIIFKNSIGEKISINELVKNKESFIKGDTGDLDFSNDEELNELLNTFDYFVNDKQLQITLPESFEEYKKELKDAIIELNISKFINYSKMGLYNYEENWDDFLDELIDIAITINDRALVLYLLYIAGMKMRDYKKINDLIKKNWEFLRFNNNNIWIDYAMRFVNNQLLFEEVLKK